MLKLKIEDLEDPLSWFSQSAIRTLVKQQLDSESFAIFALLYCLTFIAYVIVAL